MWRYVLKRLLTTFLLLFGITFIVYAILELTPGDPVMIKLGTDYTPELYEATKISMGLDKPFLVQYLSWVGGMMPLSGLISASPIWAGMW